MLPTHAQDEAKEAGLEVVARVLFPNVPNWVDSDSTKERLIQ